MQIRLSYYYFHQKKVTTKNLNFRISGQKIHQLTQVKYLGITLNENLKFKRHMEFQCPDFSLIIFEAPFLEVYLRCNAHCFSSYFNIVHTMFLCSIFLVPSSLPFAESFFLFSVFISDDEIMEVGFRVCAFFAAIFACLSTVSFSTIPLWAGQYINLIDLMDIYEVVLFLGSLCHDSFCDFAL